MINNINVKLRHIITHAFFGKVIEGISVYAQNVLLDFIIFKTQDEDEKFPFKTTRIKNDKLANIITPIGEEVLNLYLVRTDDNFRKKFKHSYDLIKFETENYVLTFGAYCDHAFPMTADNLYLQCTIDFINLLTDATKIESSEQLKDTPFEPLACIFDKKELAKELLRE